MYSLESSEVERDIDIGSAHVGFGEDTAFAPGFGVTRGIDFALASSEDSGFAAPGFVP